MTTQSDAQAGAALAAAKARQAIATRIAALVPQVEDDTSAQLVLKLAEAYAHLAAEPPRVRAS
jgi:hypothetical protein